MTKKKRCRRRCGVAGVFEERRGNWVGVGGRRGQRPTGDLLRKVTPSYACCKLVRRRRLSHNRRHDSRSRNMLSVSTWIASGSSLHSSCCWQAAKCSSMSLSHNRLDSRWLIGSPALSCCRHLGELVLEEHAACQENRCDAGFARSGWPIMRCEKGSHGPASPPAK